VAAMRWPDGVQCPACLKKDHYYLATQTLEVQRVWPPVFGKAGNHF
jgi:Transposase zinc-ribbon domain